MSDLFDDIVRPAPDERRPAQRPPSQRAPRIPEPAIPPPGPPPAIPRKSSERKEFRGVGEIHKREPIAAVVEILQRQPKPDGDWEFVRPFTRDVNPKAEFCFNVMQSVPTTKVRRGSMEAPAREPHPQFEQFNTSLPAAARTLHCSIVHFNEKDCYKYSLGAFAPPGKNYGKVPSGWWCRGDSKEAQRWVDGAFKKISCPGSLCEFQQEKFGFAKNAAHCKPHLTLISQFNWEGEILPNVIFQFDSQSWNNIANIEGMFALVRDTSIQLGYEPGTFPVFGMNFTMNLKTRVKNKRRWPEVSFSIEGSLMKWMSTLHQHLERLSSKDKVKALAAPAVRPLGDLPPPGYSADEMDNASQAALNPQYRPANER